MKVGFFKSSNAIPKDSPGQEQKSRLGSRTVSCSGLNESWGPRGASSTIGQWLRANSHEWSVVRRRNIKFTYVLHVIRQGFLMQIQGVSGMIDKRHHSKNNATIAQEDIPPKSCCESYHNGKQSESVSISSQ